MNNMTSRAVFSIFMCFTIFHRNTVRQWNHRYFSNYSTLCSIYSS
uniref:Uncharacterized protein n=1 Tax=Arundo donax TaxID=35708 RepID=A0A0A9BDF2_ARUDO